MDLKGRDKAPRSDKGTNKWIKAAVIFLVAAFTIFTALNSTLNVITVSPVKNATDNHYNIVSGYSNMTAYGSKFICWYTVGGFLHGNLNNTTMSIAQAIPVKVEFTLVNQSLQFPFNSFGFKVGNIRVVDSSVLSGLGPVALSNSAGGFDLSGQGWDLTNLLIHPGVQHIYLNFTVTPYSVFAIYKFSGVTHPYSFEWNVTVVS